MITSSLKTLNISPPKLFSSFIFTCERHKHNYKNVDVYLVMLVIFLLLIHEMHETHEHSI